MHQSKTIVAIIVAVVVVGAVAVFAAAMSFNAFDRVTAVEKQTKTVDQKVDVIGQKVEKLAEEPNSINLEPAVVTLQITQDLQRIQAQAEQDLGINFSEIKPVLGAIRTAWPSLNQKQRDAIGRDYFSCFVGTSVLDGCTDEQSNQVWDLVDEVISIR